PCPFVPADGPLRPQRAPAFLLRREGPPCVPPHCCLPPALAGPPKRVPDAWQPPILAGRPAPSGSSSRTAAWTSLSSEAGVDPPSNWLPLPELPAPRDPHSWQGRRPDAPALSYAYQDVSHSYSLPRAAHRPWPQASAPRQRRSCSPRSSVRTSS